MISYNELLKKLKSGEIKSPTVYENNPYLCVRITGTGITKRYKQDNKSGEVIYNDKGEPEEYRINRNPDLFLSDDFIKSCIGVPVLVEHPDDRLLNSDNYGQHIIGSIVDAYIKPEVKEVWGIARLYDEGIIDLIKEGLKSTSPAVMSTNKNTPEGIVEETDPYLDHLALVVEGYWDAYSQKAIQIDKKINGGKEMQEMSDANQKEIEANESSKIDLICEKLDKLLEVLVPAKKEQTTSKTDNGEVANEEVKQAATLDIILEKLSTVVDALINKATPVETKEEEVVKKTEVESNGADNGGDITSEDIVSKELTEEKKEEQLEEKVDSKVEGETKEDETEETVEEEEEKETLIDSAYSLATKYKEDGIKWCKVLTTDSKFSYIKKFVDKNKDFVDSKYKSLLGMKANKDNFALYVDAMKSIEANVEKKSLEKSKSNKSHVVFDDGKTKKYTNVW